MSATRYQDLVIDAVGDALDGVEIFVCTQPATTTTIPPAPLATLYTDTSQLTIGTNPVLSDGNGNFHFYAAPGIYTLVIYDTLQRIPQITIPDILIVGAGAGSGTVTSVGLTAPPEFTVSGSPVTGSGTLAINKAVENILTVWAGPLSGPAAAPTFKLLTDVLTAAGVVGTGTVTSVAVALSLSSLLSGSVSGSPITNSGTITLTINFANESANTFLAGPASGSPGAVVARRIVPADLPGTLTVAFAAGSPVFDASLNDSFAITLTGNAGFPTIINGTIGQVIWLLITQDATGGRTFAWPANTRGASAIGTDANSVNIQGFIYAAGNVWRALAPGYENLT